MKLPDPITLPSGLVAEMEEDKWVPGSVQLVIDGTPQSHVNLRNPSDLFFEYVRRIGHVIDLIAPPGAPISALHLGGGAFTLPRYVEATRPGSRQQVIELEGALVDLVREAAPLPQRASIRVRRGDARAVAAKLPEGMRGAMDIIVVDIFAGARTPAHVSSTEFYELLIPLLSPDGVIVINAADGVGQPFVRGQVATLSNLFGAVAAIAEPQVLKGRRFGNVVLVAASPLAGKAGAAASAVATGAQGGSGGSGNADGSGYRGNSGNSGKKGKKHPEAVAALDWLPRLLAGGPHPARMLEGKELADFARGASPVTDETAVDSPVPARELFE